MGAVMSDVRINQTGLAAAQEKRFIKSLRRMDIVLFIVAAVISMDTIGSMASGGLGSVSWGVILVVIFMVPYAMLFAETGATFPEEGGPYQWTKFAFGRLLGGVTSVMYWVTTPIWLGGSLAFIASGTFSTFVVHIPSGSVADWAFKLGYVWVAVLLAVMSLKTGKTYVNIGAWAKMAVLGLLVVTTAVYGLLHGFATQHWALLRPSFANFLYAAPVMLFSYVGFEAPNSASEEMFDAANDTGPAIRSGTIITALGYLLPVLAIVLVLPASQTSGLSGYMSALSLVFHGVYGPLSGVMIKIAAILFVISVINLGSSWMISTDRTQAMAAADGTYFNGYFGVFNERFGTPLRVNITSGIIGSLFTAAAMLIVNGSAASIFGVVLNTAVSTLLFSYLVIVPAIMVLRAKFPDRPRPYTVPGGTVGFYVMSSVVLVFLIVGAVSTIAPSVLYRIFGASYSFQDSWGVSGLRFELFTVGTLVCVVIIGLVGYAMAGTVRRDLRPIVEASVGQLD
jgi:amino acid transporter